MARRGIPTVRGSGGAHTEASAASGGGAGGGGEGEGSSSSAQGGGGGGVSPRPSPGAVDVDGDDDGRLSAVGPEEGGGGGVGVGGAAVTPNASPSLAGVDGAEEAAGGYWGLSGLGWFSRRSGMSPPPPLEEGQTAAAAVGGVVVDQGRAGASAEVDKAGLGKERLAHVTAVGAAGAKGGGRLTAPSPLSMEVLGAGRQGGEGGEESGHVSSDSDNDDDDEDLYGKTLRPTSEQLVGFVFRSGVWCLWRLG